LELNTETHNTLENEVYTYKATSKEWYVISGDSEAKLPHSYLAQQCLPLELSCSTELFNKQEILHLSTKGNDIQPNYTREYFSHPTFSQTL